MKTDKSYIYVHVKKKLFKYIFRKNTDSEVTIG